MRLPSALVLLPFLAGPAGAAPPPFPASLAELGVDQARVEAAIGRGAEWLCKDLDNTLKDYGWAGGNQCDDVLILYALVKSGARFQARPEFQRVLQQCLERRLERTYRAAVLAMALEALDAPKYAGHIQNCAQFLIDNQSDNGQWDYGQAVDLPTPSLGPDRVATPGGNAGEAVKPRGNTTTKKKLTRRGKGRDDGDNSNTQYAILGLRSCEEAGFGIPNDTWRQALKWWEVTQQPDGGWNYAPRHAEGTYLAMTEGGLGSMVICMHYLQQNWKGAQRISLAYNYITQRFTCTDNTIEREGNAKSFQYYHLYAIERAGMLVGREVFGAHVWYREGSEYLLGQQKGDGSWESAFNHQKAVHDTAFAILFLSRATRPIVYSGH